MSVSGRTEGQSCCVVLPHASACGNADGESAHPARAACALGLGTESRLVCPRTGWEKSDGGQGVTVTLTLCDPFGETFGGFP